VTAGFVALLLLAIWVSLGFDKLHAVEFVGIVVAAGFVARAVTKMVQGRNPKLPLIRQAILEHLTPEAFAAPKILVGTYGSDKLALPAIRLARMQGATLVVCFIREVSLSYKYDRPLTLETDPVAIRVFARYLELAHDEGVKVMPVYDSASDAAVAMAESAAMNSCHTILIGSSRESTLVHLVKGHFQRRLEAMLPGDIRVEVVRHESNTEPAPNLGRVAAHA
jgi:K+-sensing histidine kinase KdpD